MLDGLLLLTIGMLVGLYVAHQLVPRSSDLEAGVRLPRATPPILTAELTQALQY